MTIQYVLETENFNKMVEERKLEGVYPVDADEYNYVEIDIDFTQDNVSAWGCVNGSAVFFGDYITVDLDYLEEQSETKEVSDLYVDNVEIAQYLEHFDIPHQWALDAVDEWREDEEEALDDAEFWEAVDGIKTAYRISREES